ncbi:hypothetical protein APY03_0099 [Variovorax sp. WDL1]|nr:hypothetical protein APY03_0099 [Variovorax sp. WDL1]
MSEIVRQKELRDEGPALTDGITSGSGAGKGGDGVTKAHNAEVSFQR